jgi:glycosyltransferase involved in cell wall biosynthesis
VTRIVGISLVRDEDRFVERAIRNVFRFCDELILVDHRSTDQTPAILERLAAESPVPTALHRVRNPSESHDLIKGRAGEDVWVFGVDGDELYDPRGLERFREQLLAGEAAEDWQLRANMLHVVELDEEHGLATGYLSPPAPSVSKLFNFARIEAWDGDNPERLHDPSGLVFKPGAEARKRELNRELGWDDSPFRALHVCFLRRSSRQRADGARINIPDRLTPRRAPVRAWRALREAAGRPPAGAYKDLYRVGELVTVDARPFLGSDSSTYRATASGAARSSK